MLTGVGKRNFHFVKKLFVNDCICFPTEEREENLTIKLQMANLFHFFANLSSFANFLGEFYTF